MKTAEETFKNTLEHNNQLKDEFELLERNISIESNKGHTELFTQINASHFKTIERQLKNSGYFIARDFTGNEKATQVTITISW